MKKLFFLFVAGAYSVSAMARQPDSDTIRKHDGFRPDSLLSQWVVDVNLLGGGLTQNYSTVYTARNYPNATNFYPGNLKFSKGSSYGFDAQLAYFFGPNNLFGIGTGFNYMHQSGTATLDSFHAQYLATSGDNSFSQAVSSDHSIQEKLNITNLNIPVLLKFKYRFSKHWGFMTDAGVLVNLQIKNSYSTNAAFTYDNLSSNVIQSGVKPGSTTGSVSYTSGSVGLLVRPAFNYYLSDNVALTFGAYYMLQPFKNAPQFGYELTNGAGNYSSALNSASAATTQSYGFNLGVRIYVFKPKDKDGDGIPDKKDRCPVVYGLQRFRGCPDTDGDGIPDPDDSCPTEAGLAQFHGCPDSDGDGFPDRYDSCPTEAGLARFQGCPDRDSDGVPDKDDLCPDVPGLAQFQGCPDTDGDGVPDKDDKCPTVAGLASNGGCPVIDTPKPAPPQAIVPDESFSHPILFEVNKTVVHKVSYPTLNEAVRIMNADPDASVVIDGYADNTGKASYNKKLSLKRSKAVKAKLIKMGINSNRIIVKGHGSKSPVASNRTKKGRQQNRRAVLHLNVNE